MRLVPEQLSMCPRGSKLPWVAVCIPLRSPWKRGVGRWWAELRTDRELCEAWSETHNPEIRKRIIILNHFNNTYENRGG